jgi:hypothetical protein
VEGAIGRKLKVEEEKKGKVEEKSSKRIFRESGWEKDTRRKRGL